MTALAAIVLLGVLIFVHEFGHFLVAKACRVRVLRFSLGFGPPLLRRNIGETEYWISAFPLGGYVKMLGDEAAAGLEEIRPVAESERHLSFGSKPLWQRFAIVAAGPIMNLVLPVVILFVLAIGPRTDAVPRASIVIPGGAAAAAGVLPGDVVLEIDGEPVPHWTALREKISANPGVTLQVVVDREGQRVPLSITPARRQELDRFGREVEVGRVGISPNRHTPVVGLLSQNSVAAQAGVRAFDRVVQVGGQPVATLGELRAAVETMTRDPARQGQDLELLVKRAQRSELELVDARLELPVKITLPAHGIAAALSAAAPGDKAFEALGLARSTNFVRRVERDSPAWRAGLRRGDQVLRIGEHDIAYWWTVEEHLRQYEDTPTFTLQWLRNGARMQAEVTLEHHENKTRYGQRVEEYVFGAFGLVEQLPAETLEYDAGPSQAISESLKETWDMVFLVAEGLAKFAAERDARDSLGGPIMIMDIAGRAAQAGVGPYVRIMAAISVNLAVLNLLPIPMLDGGHLFFFMLEGVRRRPVARRWRETANLAGLAALVMLLVYAFWNDVSRYWDKIVAFVQMLG